MGESQYIVYRYDQDAAQSGLECVYYSHAILLGGQWWGIKSYRTASVRDEAHYRQSLGFRDGYGPPTGGYVKVRIQRRGKKDIIRYGYYTAQCRPFTSVEHDEDGDEIDHPLVDAMEARVKKLGVNLTDLGSRNLGWWNGSLVLIDFGESSFV